MTDTLKDAITPIDIDVGVSPDHPGGVVSIFNFDGGTALIIALPAEAAILYAEELKRRAAEILGGKVPVSSPVAVHAVSIARARGQKLDS